jgi:hypothetical protein
VTTPEDRLRSYYRDEAADIESVNVLPSVLAAGRRARRRARALWASALAGLAVVLLSVFAGLSLRAHVLPAAHAPAAAHQHSTAASMPTTSSAVKSPSPSQSCGSQGGLTVCPGMAAVGETVSITAETTCGAGASGHPILMFQGPVAAIASVTTTMSATGFTASFRIPSSYPGTQQSGTAGLSLPVAPGNVYQFSTSAGACWVPFTVAPAPSDIAGAFADTWHFHVTTLSIASDGQGAATWEDPTLCGTTSSGCFGDTAATFVLSDVSGTTARAVIQASNDPRYLPVGTVLTLTLQPHDTLTVSGVSAGSAFYNTPLCGSQAASLSVTQQKATGINCGA